MAVKRIGVFNTPKKIVNFGNIKVYDFRETESTVAEWFLINQKNIQTYFILADSEEKVIGHFFQGEKYLKCNSSTEDVPNVVMAKWWPGNDVSRTGRHGTQWYAYLAIDLLCEQGDEFSLSGGAFYGSLGMEGFVKETISSFPKPRSGYGMSKLWKGLQMDYTNSYSQVGGCSPDGSRRVSYTPYMNSVISLDGKSFEVFGTWDYGDISTAIREKISNLPINLEEALIVEDSIRDESQIIKLFQFYLKTGNVVNHEILVCYNRGDIWKASEDCLSEDRMGTKDLAQKHGVPEWLVTIFEDTNKLKVFIKNVDALDKTKLDYHLCCVCGEKRARKHIIAVSGGNIGFFQGANPLDVKKWIWDR